MILARKAGVLDWDYLERCEPETRGALMMLYLEGPVVMVVVEANEMLRACGYEMIEVGDERGHGACGEIAVG